MMAILGAAIEPPLGDLDATIAAVDATNEFGGVITSSPALSPSARMPRMSASVPELSATTCRTPT